MAIRTLSNHKTVHSCCNCYDCRAFSSTGAIEGAYAIATNNLLDLSEGQLVDCVTGSNGCDGGWMTAAFSDIIARGGIEQTSAYGAYAATRGTCRFDASAVSVVLSGYTDVPLNDENALLQVRQ